MYYIRDPYGSFENYCDTNLLLEKAGSATFELSGQHNIFGSNGLMFNSYKLNKNKQAFIFWDNFNSNRPIPKYSPSFDLRGRQVPD